MDQQSQTDVAADITKLLASVVETQRATFDRIMAIEQRVSQVETDLRALDVSVASLLKIAANHADVLEKILKPATAAPEPPKRMLN